MIYRVAAVQAKPVWHDLRRGVATTVGLIRTAKANGAHLIAFPECWIPGYPLWLEFNSPMTVALEVSHVDNCLTPDSDEMEMIRRAARDNEINVVLGYSEKQGGHISTGQCLITSEGQLQMMYRNLIPELSTGYRTRHYQPPITDSKVVESGIGRVGVLCGIGHTRPLLKHYLIQKQEDIHISTWPPRYRNDAQTRVPWRSTVEASHALSRVYAIESSTYVLHTASYISEGTLDRWGIPPDYRYFQNDAPAAIFGRDGAKLTEDLVGTDERIVYANIVRDGGHLYH